MAQVPVYTQRIWGAFSPTTNLIVGVQTSGEGPYQNVANALITTTYGGVRTATAAATNMILTLGKSAQGDGGGATFVFNPTDVSSGCVCTGSSVGTVLTVTAVQSGNITVGLTLASATTGLPLATILSFGTGLGQTGTYNLSGPVNLPLLQTFLLDNGSTILVSADGSRWYLQSSTVANFTTVNAPSGNPAIRLTTPAYTFGNTLDNPTYSFAGTGATTFGGAVTFTTTTTHTGAAAFNNNVTITPLAGVGLTATGVNGQNIALFQVPGFSPGNNQGVLISAGSNSSDYSFQCQTQGVISFQVRGDRSLFGQGPTAGALVDMTPDTGSATLTLTGCTTSPTATSPWTKMGNLVFMMVGSVTGTSNATTLSLTGLPAEIIPTTGNQQGLVLNWLTDNGAATTGSYSVTNTGTINFYKGTSQALTSWTAAGSKGVAANTMIIWAIKP